MSALAVQLLGELTMDFRTVWSYSYGLKGWGPPLPEGGGDCTALALGVWRRVGLLPFGSLEPVTKWKHISANNLREACAHREPSDVRVLDLATWSGHVGIVMEPGRWILDCGGGGRQTKPGGTDWPPEKGCARLISWDYWASERLGFRAPLALQVREDDRRLVREWTDYLDRARGAVANGVPAPALAQGLQDAEFRPWRVQGPSGPDSKWMVRR